MRKIILVMYLVGLANPSFSRELSHALFYIFSPTTNGPSYSYWLDTKTDSLKIETLVNSDLKTYRFKLDSITVDKIFTNGKNILESLSFDKSHKPSISNFYLNLQISHNLKNKTVEITDEYYFKKITRRLEELNKLLPSEFKLPLEQVDFTLKKKVEKYANDTCFKFTQKKGYQGDSKEIFYSTHQRDSIEYRVYTDKLIRRNIYLDHDNCKSLSDKVIGHLNAFVFGQGNTITTENFFETELWLHYPGINITARYFTRDEFNKYATGTEIRKYVNDSILREDVFE